MVTQAPPPPPASKPAPPPPSRTPSGKSPESRPATDASQFRIESGVKKAPQKVVIYSGGGAGKTSLAALLGTVGVRPLFIDLEQGSHQCDVDRIDSVQAWDQLRAVLHSPAILDPYDAVVIDSLTKAEEMAVAWTVANVPHEKGHLVNSIEGYGFGKGLTHVYETFIQLLGDLDAVARRGKHVVCTAHECTATVPNPTGEDWIRYEPRLQSPASGKNSIRHRVREWCDHLFFIGYDVFAKEGKGVGTGTRAIYPAEQATHMAKSRVLRDAIAYPIGSADLWKQLQLNKGER